MPEYFFHIRLNIAGRPTGKHGSRKARIFASPTPQFDIVPYPAIPSKNITLNKASAGKDWRAGRITIQSIDMVPAEDDEQRHVLSSSSPNPDGASSSTLRSTVTAATAPALTSINKRITSSPGSVSTRARFEPSDLTETEVGYGVVRLYRDIHETPELYGDGHYSRKASRVHTPAEPATEAPVSNLPFREEDCTTLCILAIPSYFSPTRFISWVGDATREEVSHFRMLRTEDSSRYMVLMRFRNSRKAREWRKEWNGSPFDDASPEIAQVVFVKSIELMPDEDPGAGASFPDMAQDPLRGRGIGSLHLSSPTPATLGLKAPAPPTPSLVEMPTCPVCLERMDESSGLLTILCQHVFHCSCLYKWRGTGCPVCRFTHSGLSGKKGAGNFGGQPDEDNATGPNECSICRSEANLWICLVCGNIGCGRYDAAHAFLHWQHSGHAFSMDMTNQRIWDYESDAYVHRIVQNKLDGKITTSEGGDGAYVTGNGAPGASSSDNNGHRASSSAYDDFASDYLPREKTDAIGREYTALLTSQLESQRAYFEEKVSAAADKASQASAAAIEAAQAASKALSELTRLRDAYTAVTETTVPELERERDRAARRADQAREMARRLEREWRDEKTLAEGLHTRIKTLDAEVAQLRADRAKASEEIADQADMIRDLQFFISGQQKLKEMEDELGEEIAEGTVSVPESRRTGAGGKKGGRKAKGKAKAKEKEKEKENPGDKDDGTKSDMIDRSEQDNS